MKTPTTYYCGFFRGRPHVTAISADYATTAVFLFRTKKEAQAAGFDEVRKVKIVEVK